MLTDADPRATLAAGTTEGGGRAMGLDISYASRLRRVECDDPDNCDHDYTVWPHPDFPGREAPLEAGHYETEGGDHGGFRAGSYFGYNGWRNALAALSGAAPVSWAPSGGEGVPSCAAAIWGDPERYAGLPFVELVHFSDCDGVIGPEVSAKLAGDFAAHDERARAAMDEYSYGKYCEWRRAFEVAANGGAVFFH